MGANQAARLRLLRPGRCRTPALPTLATSTPPPHPDGAIDRLFAASDCWALCRVRSSLKVFPQSVGAFLNIIQLTVVASVGAGRGTQPCQASADGLAPRQRAPIRRSQHWRFHRRANRLSIGQMTCKRAWVLRKDEAYA